MQLEMKKSERKW